MKYFARPLEPYLGFGDRCQVESQAELESAARSVEVAGYLFRDGVYVWQPDRVVHAHTPADFLFSHYLSRYTAAQVDQDSSAFRVFILGGSVAQGLSASSKHLTWHAVLEQQLCAEVDDVSQSNRVRVFNCAMGGFVTTQERLALVLAVYPRKPDLVIILNGANDMILPLSHGSRPGDPYLQSTLLKYWYERSIGPDRTLPEATRHMLGRRTADILADPQQRKKLVASIFNVYTENMAFCISLCKAMGCVAHVCFQPWRDRARTASPFSAESCDFGPEVRTFLDSVHDLICAHMHGAFPDSFHDLSDLYSRTNGSSYFTDAVHLNDQGHRILAEAIYESVKGSAVSAISKAWGPP